MKPIIIVLACVFSSFAFSDQQLAMQSSCMGCHKVDGKGLGPSFKSIATKYKDNESIIPTLVTRVKQGSKAGVWGAMPMPPSQASEERIQKIVKWIMTLK